MVREDVRLDINGIPEKLPSIFYLRTPLLKTVPGTFEDWKKRNSGPKRLLGITELEIKRLETEVAKIPWERELRAKPSIPEETIALHERIIEILGGRPLRGT